MSVTWWGEGWGKSKSTQLVRNGGNARARKDGVRKFSVAWFIVVKNLEMSRARISVVYALSRTSKRPILEVLGAGKREAPLWEDEKGNFRLFSFVQVLFVSSEV